jgi:hypothetical protein
MARAIEAELRDTIRGKLLGDTRATKIDKTRSRIERIEGQTRFLRIAISFSIR